MTKVGFIGLGKMGAAMARNVSRSLPVVVFDVNPEAARGLTSDNLTVAETAHAAANGVDVLVTMLPGPEEIEQVMGGTSGAASRLAPGAVWIDMSSSSLEAMEHVLQLHENRSWSALDAPVTGGVPGAEEGTLQIFVGGAAEDLAKARPVLELMGQPDRILHVGQLGAGYAVKLCLNLGFFLHAIAGAEVMTLGVKAGVDLNLLHEALTGSGASSAFLENDLVQNIYQGDYKEYFRLELALKDIRLAVDLGRRVGTPLEVAALVEQIHRRALLTYGDGGQLLAVKQLEETSGVWLRRED